MINNLFQALLTTHPALMLYFYNDSCGVCKVLWPQVEQLVWEEFPEIQLVRVNAAESRELAGQLRMLSVPGMVLFMEGKEYFRINGMVPLAKLEEQIVRPAICILRHSAWHDMNCALSVALG